MLLSIEAIKERIAEIEKELLTQETVHSKDYNSLATAELILKEINIFKK